MAKIKPFKALRYNNAIIKDISQVVCPVYDIVSKKQEENLLKKNKYNMIRLERPYNNDYKKANLLFCDWKNSGVLKKDTKNSFYLYEEEFIFNGKLKKQRGIICLVALEEFKNGIILPHEETLFKASENRLNLLKNTFCNFSCVQSLYIDENKKTNKKLEPYFSKSPINKFSDDNGIIHKLWVVNDANIINDICNDFKNRKLYIADGHHRYATALQFKNENKNPNINSNYIMMVLTDFEDPGIIVLPTHRIIKNIENFNADDLLKKLEKYFYLTKNLNIKTITNMLLNEYNQNKVAMALYLKNGNYILLKLKDKEIIKKLNSSKSSTFCNLDVVVLHSLILENILKIDKEKIKNQTSLNYTVNLNDAVSCVDTGKAQCAFILNSTKMEQIKNLALLGEKLPQKSTYFYPKPLAGLTINELQQN